MALTGHATATDSTAIVHGMTYRWDTIEPLDNTVIEINSTPPQSMVAKKGEYSFELGPGDYNITAKYYQNGVLTYSTEETFKIEEGGNYVYDLLLIPVSSKINEPSASVNETSEDPSLNKTAPTVKEPVPEESDKNNSNITGTAENIWIRPMNLNYLLILFMLFFLLAGGYGLFRRHKTKETNAFQKEDIENKEGSFFKFLKIKELSTRASGKNDSSKIKQEFKADTEGIISAQEANSKTSKGLPSNSRFIGKESTAEIREYSTKNIGTESELAEESRDTGLEESAENPENENSTLEKKLPLSTDLQEVVDVIRGYGGRITQKDLRNRLKYSEVKVSLLLSELEKRNLVKKLKRGRENIVILRDEEL